MRYFLIGLPGSGKSHWGKIWAEKSKLMYFDLDEIIENNEGEIIKDIFNDEGESYFRNLETFYLNKLIDNYRALIISCGGGTACFNDNMQLMAEKGNTVFLNPPTEKIARRIWDTQGNQHRPLFSKCKSAHDVANTLNDLKSKRVEYYKQAQYQWESWDENSIEMLRMRREA